MAGDRLAGKVALVTGGGGVGGFGAAIAQKFLGEGAKVLVGDINVEGVKSWADKHGDNLKVAGMDVTTEDGWKSGVKECIDTFGRIDILVNNAGWTYRNKPTLDVTADEFDKVFAINVRSIFLSVGAVVPHMQKQGNGGSIINISSIGSVRPRPGLVWYNSSKGAVTNATMGLAAEYGRDGIRVNAIAPLLSGTQLFESFVGVPHTEDNVKKFLGNVPLGRLTDPTDVANTALFLASDEGAFISGVNMQVDGGRAVGS